MSMTQTEVNTFVDAYFNVHLDKAYWTGLTADTRAACVSMAVTDVCVELNLTGLNMLDALKENPLKAIAEQAVYISRTHESFEENKIEMGENIEGMSSSYKLVGSKAGLSHRAETFIKLARQTGMSPLRTTRG